MKQRPVSGGICDFLECHIESWTVTTDGRVWFPGIKRHFIRIHPVDITIRMQTRIRTGASWTIRNDRREPSGLPRQGVVDGGSWSWSAMAF